jgi:hypothetical protein
MEKLFTLKKGTEVADRFDGLTIPYTEADSLQHAIELANGEQNLVAIFNQAYRLNLQKDVKSIANKDDTTVEILRARASNYKPEQVRVRDPNAEPKSASSGVVKQAKAKASVLDELLRDNPELAAKYAERLAGLNVNTNGQNGAAAPAAATATIEKPAKSKK